VEVIKKPLWIKIAIAIGALAVISLVVIIVGRKATNQPAATNTTSPSSTPEVTDANVPLPTFNTQPQEPDKLKHINILVLGYGGAGHEGGFLTDVMMVAHLDLTKKVISLITIPRDLWIAVPEIGANNARKINSYFLLKTNKPQNYPRENVARDEALGGAQASAAAVKLITSLPIDYYVGIDFNSFKAAIDSIKGVDVDVPEAFVDEFYPVRGRELELCDKTPEEVTRLSQTLSGFELEKQFPCRYEKLDFKKGMAHMDGETALKFVRSRHSSSDFARSMRQQALLVGVRNKLLSLKVLDKIPDFYKQVIKMINTNLDVKAIEAIAPGIKDIGEYRVQKINLSTQNVLENSKAASGAYILVPKNGINNWPEVQSFIKAELNKTGE
jgi:LCP family protein required for cell wall assembly